MDITLSYYKNPEIVDSYFEYCMENGCPNADALIEIMKQEFGKTFNINDGFLIDLACGFGSSTVALSKLGFAKYLGVDFSPEMLERFPQYAERHNIKAESVEMNLCTGILPVKDTVADMVSCCSAYIYTKELEHSFKEASRVLKHNGLFGFNVITHQGPINTTYDFLDDDNIPMFVHQEKYILETGLRFGCMPLVKRFFPEHIVYVPGIKSFETTFLFRKK